MRFIQFEPFASITATSDAYSDPVEIASVFSMGMHVHVLTGTAKGKAYFQVSCDPIGSTPANFVTYGTGADLTGSEVQAYSFTEIAANWVRIFWDHSSGSGTLRVHLKTNGY